MISRRFCLPLLAVAFAWLSCGPRSGADQAARPSPSAALEAVQRPAEAPIFAKESPIAIGEPIARQTLLDAIRLGGHYLTRATRPSGRFVYRINLNPDAEVEGGYNVLRHAGSLYAMGQIQQRWPDGELRAALLRGAGYLRREHMAPLPDAPEVRAVWSRRTKHGLREAKLGGAGLGLLALSRLEGLAPGTTPRAELNELAAFVQHMQKPDGSFYSKLYTDKRGRSDAWTSLYYPGEAAFGLVALVEQSGEQRWLEHSLHALLYLARLRRGRLRVEADHWALLATEAVLRRLSQAPAAEGGEDPRPLLIEHAAQICRSMLDASPDYPASSERHGSLTRGGRTTPTATRLEGLLAALQVLPEAHPQRKAIRRAIDSGVRFLLRAQRRSGKHAGAVPASFPLGDEASSEVRIDYVQHAVSAWIGYLELIDAEAGTVPKADAETEEAAP